MQASIIHGSLQDNPRILFMEASRIILEYVDSVVLGYLWLVYFLAQLANYCGLNVNFPPKLICVSTGSLASSTVWVPVESLGGGVMLKEVGHGVR